MVPSPIKHTLSQWLFLICMNLSEKKMAELRGAGKPRAGRISDYKSFVQLLEVSKVRFMWKGAFVGDADKETKIVKSALLCRALQVRSAG